MAPSSNMSMWYGNAASVPHATCSSSYAQQSRVSVT